MNRQFLNYKNKKLPIAYTALSTIMILLIITCVYAVKVNPEQKAMTTQIYSISVIAWAILTVWMVKREGTKSDICFTILMTVLSVLFLCLTWNKCLADSIYAAVCLKFAVCIMVWPTTSSCYLGFINAYDVDLKGTFN